MVWVGQGTICSCALPTVPRSFLMMPLRSLVPQADFLKSHLCRLLSESQLCPLQVPETHSPPPLRKGAFSRTQARLGLTRTTFGTEVVVLFVTLLAVWLLNSLSLRTSFFCFSLHMVGNGCAATGNRPQVLGERISWVPTLGQVSPRLWGHAEKELEGFVPDPTRWL